jgi:aspartyl protease family protein
MKSWHGWLLLLLSGHALAVDSITVMALFDNAAMIRVDGQQRLLRGGETSPEGVTLISADSTEAVLEINGQRDTYALNRAISNIPGKSSSASLKIAADSSGMYLTTGMINGYSIKFIVDTGATLVTLNSAQAAQIGIDYRDAPTALMSTASGVVKGYIVKLDSVQIGTIHKPYIEAVILEGRHPSEALLGMSFLGQLEVRHDGGFIELRER